MKTLLIELRKEKRTGVIPVLLAVGILGAAYAFVNFLVRKDTLLNLPLAPMDVLLTQLYGMIMVLNLFGIVVATCMIYNMEFKGSAVKKMYMLPVSVPAIYLCKFLILTVMFLIAIMLQNLALAQIGMTDLPNGTFEMSTLVRFAGYSFLTSMPVLSFMLLISSRFENMWVPLGIGVAGFLSGMALANSGLALLLVHPFVIILKPAVAMNAQPDPTVALVALSETLLFLAVGLWLAKYKRYEEGGIIKMSFWDLLKIEFMKVKRSKIIPLIFIAPLLVVVSGVASLSNYFTPEYTNAWPAMFIQSALVYAYYLLPFSMIVVCVMITGRETGNNGILKMLALPISRYTLSIAKFCVLTFYLFMEMVVFLVVFVIAGLIATQTMGVTETLPLLYLLKWCLGLFLTMLPCIAAMWAITVLFEKPLLSVGLNLLLVIPGVLVANTPLWIVYPYCYSGYLVSCSLHDFTAETSDAAFSMFPFLPCAIVVFGLFFALAVTQFGKKEMR